MRADFEALAEKVIQRLLTNNRDDGTDDHLTIAEWEWPQGVALYGLYQYYRETGKQEYLDFSERWYEDWMARGLPSRNVNTAAPLLTLAHLYELTGKPEQLDLCRDWAEWMRREMPRTEEGGLQHLTSHLTNEQQIWADTLFMTVLFLAKLGRLTFNEAYIQEAIRQFLLHIKYLHDPGTGLWYHGWSFRGRHAFGKNLWARGNCWFTAGVVELLEILELQGAVRQHLLDTLASQVRKLAELQHEAGMWHTLLDEPASYVETSATAGFAYGILKAIRLGYLDSRYETVGKKAAAAVLGRVGPDGAVGGVSYGTAIGMKKEHYMQIEQRPTAYGQGLTLLLLTELLRE
ncbi:MAG: glycoside hydrolase family 88 protein [Bacillota bacterium]|jgi:unsaturated rhamnogalacturonyl hydrolase